MMTGREMAILLGSSIALDAGAADAAGALPLPEPLTAEDFPALGDPNPHEFILGQALMFDSILSGRQNISCATCHFPALGTGDGLALPLGTGARGLGPQRVIPEPNEVLEFVPRNSPPLWSLGADDVPALFHDRRVRKTASGFRSPAGDRLPEGLTSLLAVQAMFPVTSATEMAGLPTDDNPIGRAAAAGDLEEIWRLLADRLRAVPGYRQLFRDAYGLEPDEITYVHAANAIGAFEAAAFASFGTPFDRYLAGDGQAMSPDAVAGMRLFYGGHLDCAGCHRGSMLSDFDCHVLGVPQIGPGKGFGVQDRTYEDFGCGGEADQDEKRYSFRTPPLRNIAVTGPYGHDGAFVRLEDMVRHHLNARVSLNRYDCQAAVAAFPTDPDFDDVCAAHDDRTARARIRRAIELKPRALSRPAFGHLMTFLREGLTDSRLLGGIDGTVPDTVPSGLPVDRLN